MITIDGSQGEGGGQILRTALALSMITATPFRLEKIRAKRMKPGLLRQHLTCVTAAQKISSAKVDGAGLGSSRITFVPGAIKGGAYDFAIGTAGSTALVFQTVLLALLHADTASTIRLSGGTHVPFAPTFDYLDRVYLPLLRRMGAEAEIRLATAGFYPAGGGRWSAGITPSGTLRPLVLESAGQITGRRIVADVANIAYDVAEREAAAAAALLSWPADTIQARTIKGDGPGNVLAIHIEAEHVTELFTAFGERGRTVEAVADIAVGEARDYLVAGAPVGPHLADQLLLPMALAGAGQFITVAPSEHTRTNIRVIEAFLAVAFATDRIDEHRWRISVSR